MLELTDLALEILQKRYFHEGEDWTGLCHRVSSFLSSNRDDAERFFDVLHDGLFLLNTPALINAGRDNPMLSACFVLPIEDSMSDIFQCLKNASEIYRTGGGVGFTFSNLRPEGALVNSTGGTSSGPISFIKVFDQAVAVIKAAGVRRGAAMGLFHITHPDVIKFIKCKSQDGDISNFNISIAVTDEFMDKALSDVDEPFITEFGGDKYVTRKSDDVSVSVPYDETMDIYSVRDVWDLICKQARHNAEPGVMFWDEIQRKNGPDIVGVNPCMPNSAMILTPYGIKQFVDIDVGSIIWSGSKWTKVVRKIYSGKKRVYKYGTTAGEIVSTSNHRVMQNGEKVEVGNAHSIDICTYDGGVEKIKHIPQIVMDGLVLGDGSKCQKRVCLYIGNNDDDYFDSEIKDLILNKIHGTKYNVDTTIRISELPKTYERKIPDRLFFGRTEVETCSLLRGLYSANGSICRKRVTYKASSFSMTRQIQILLSSIGIRSYYTTNKPTVVKFRNGEYECKQSYDLNITVDRGIFCQKIGFIQQYKMDKLYDACESIGYPKKTAYDIVNVEDLGIMDVYDITVDDEEHTYWSGGKLILNCGELPLENWGACCLGSIDVSKCFEDSGINYMLLADATNTAVDMLNAVIDKGEFPLKEIAHEVKTRRKIGLGIMGFADLLIKMKIKYGTEESLEIAEILMDYVQTTARNRSNEMGYNNTGLTTLAPTGTIGLIAGCSQGIEPNFAFETTHNRDDFGQTTVYHKLAKPYFDKGHHLPDYFVKAQDVTPEQHVLMQAAFQKYTCNAISKTVNMPSTATIEDVANVYKLAWQNKCKGVTVYRDGSRAGQVLSDASACKDVENANDDRPRVLESKTYQVQADVGDRVENVYISIGLKNDKPYEIFQCGNISGVSDITHQYFDTVTRLVSLALRRDIPIDRIVRQLNKAPCDHMFSIPHKIAKILCEFSTDGQKQKCPECDSEVMFIEGCVSCKCGWSKCG